MKENLGENVDWLIDCLLEVEHSNKDRWDAILLQIKGCKMYVLGYPWSSGPHRIGFFLQYYMGVSQKHELKEFNERKRSRVDPGEGFEVINPILSRKKMQQ